MTISRLSFVSVYSTICTKSIVIAYKICYKQLLYFGLTSVPPKTLQHWFLYAHSCMLILYFCRYLSIHQVDISQNLLICKCKPVPDVTYMWTLKYCTISNSSSPLCDCDTPDKIFISSSRLRACNMPKFSSGLRKFARI